MEEVLLQQPVVLKLPDFARIRRCEFDASLDDCAVVIDNGSYNLRAGWSNERYPRIAFPNQICKPRSRWTNELTTVVGGIDGGVKGFDFGRTSTRTAFDGNVVVNFETQEAVLDYTFDRLSLPGPTVGNTVIITECCLNPPHSRATMAELLFEAYGVPAAQFAPDAVCAYGFNVREGESSETGLLVGSGHSATHIVPIIDNQPQFSYSKRLKACGMIASDYLQQQLALSNPHAVGMLLGTHVTAIKHQLTYCSQNYKNDLATVTTRGLVQMQFPLPLSQRPPKEVNDQGFHLNADTGVAHRDAPGKADEKECTTQAEISKMPSHDAELVVEEKEENPLKKIRLSSRPGPQEEKSNLSDLITKDTWKIVEATRDFHSMLPIDQIRVPEILFQPSLCGLQQSGIVETIGEVLKNMPPELADRCAEGGLLITGGNAAFPGLVSRLECDLLTIRPQGKPMRVIASKDFMLDAWRGACLSANIPGAFSAECTTLSEYEESGSSRLRAINPIR